MRKGLFIGINNYNHVSKLSGCNNDAMAMASVLERHASDRPNFSNKVVTSSEEEVSLTTTRRAVAHSQLKTLSNTRLPGMISQDWPHTQGSDVTVKPHSSYTSPNSAASRLSPASGRPTGIPIHYKDF